MSDWWWFILLAVIAVAAVLVVLRMRGGRVTPAAPNDPARDYTGERETGRLADMSDEDRAWEAASLQRNRESEARDQDPPAPR